MTKSKIRSLCINLCVLILFFLVWLVRWNTYPPVLPSGWMSSDAVCVTLRVVDEPLYREHTTQLTQGQWKIVARGYQPLERDRLYRFCGVVTPHYFWSKPVRYTLTVQSIEPVAASGSVGKQLVGRLSQVRERMIAQFLRVLPSPESNLGSGLLLGQTGVMSRVFTDALASTGTMHIVAASGYNVTVVGQATLAILIPFLGKLLALPFSGLVIILYVVLAGASPAVVRAGVMGILTLISRLAGRQSQAKRLLWVAAALMLVIDPYLIADVGFQLSVSATAGILYGEPIIHRLGDKIVRNSILQAFLSEYLYPTLAATFATLPIIAWTFGRMSWVSPIVNMLVLPAVPMAMLTSFVCLILNWIPIVGSIVGMVAYVLLWYIVSVIRLVGSFGL